MTLKKYFTGKKTIATLLIQGFLVLLFVFSVVFFVWSLMQYNEIMDLGDALFAIHFNDNRGTCDEHMAPYMGTMNVDEIMHALIDVGFQGPLTFESGAGLRPSHYWFGNRVEYPADTRFLEPTKAAVLAYDRMLFAIGEEILTSYGIYDQ